MAIFKGDEADLACDKYESKAYHTEKSGNIKFLLSFEEYCQLMVDSGIKPSDIGRGSHKYCLGRKNEITGEVDTGNYEIGNCRFVTQKQNLSEAQKGKVVSESSKNKMRDAKINRTPEERNLAISRSRSTIANRTEEKQKQVTINMSQAQLRRGS